VLIKTWRKCSYNFFSLLEKILPERFCLGRTKAKYDFRVVINGMLQVVEVNTSTLFNVVEISRKGICVKLLSPEEEEKINLTKLTYYVTEFSRKKATFLFCLEREAGIEPHNFEVDAHLKAVTSAGVLVFEVKGRGNRKKLQTILDFVIRKTQLKANSEPVENSLPSSMSVNGNSNSNSSQGMCQSLCSSLQPLVYSFINHYVKVLREDAFHKKMKSSIIFFVFVFFILSGVIFSIVSQFMVDYQLNTIVSQYEKKYNAKIFYFIHRKKNLGIFGIPLYEYLEVYDAHRFLRDLRSVPQDKNLVIILHSPGGELLAAMQIAKVLKDWKGRVDVVVPYYAMSAGTLIALSADVIYAYKDVAFGPIDPQVTFGNGDKYTSAVDVYRTCRNKTFFLSLEDNVICETSRKVVKQMEIFLREVVLNGRDQKTVNNVINAFLYTEKPHDSPFFASDLRKMGLNVIFEIPKELNELSSLLISSHKK